MKLLMDMHTHTTYSRHGHGKNTIEEMVMQARKMGLKGLVISDHGRSHPLYGVRKSDFAKMRKEIDALNQRYDDIDIFLSVESNITGRGTIDIQEEELRYCDWIICGYHYGFIPQNMKSFFNFLLPNFLATLLPFLKPFVKKINTQCYIDVMNNYPVVMITHPGDKIAIDIEPIAKKAAEKNVILEINPSHGHLSVEDIKKAMNYPVCFAINSDAHSIGRLAKVTGAKEMMAAAGLPNERVVNTCPFAKETR